MVLNRHLLKLLKHLVCLPQADGGNTESSGLGDVFDTHVSHLSTLHFNFLRHWDRLIDLEGREMQVSLEYKVDCLLEYKVKNFSLLGDLMSMFVFSFYGKILRIHMVQRAATQLVIFLQWFLT